jgi:hypothetical protein
VRSRWLDWPNRAQEIEKNFQNSATKPTKPGFDSFVSVGSAAKTVPETGRKRDAYPSERRGELPVADPYAVRMRTALLDINQPDYPAGMIRWLESVHPDLYAELTSHLPDEIHRLWTERAPLERFETVLTRLTSLHRECCNLCRAAQKGPTSVPKTSQFDFGAPNNIEEAG